MMRIICLVMLPLAWSYGEPNSEGGGAFAYVDSTGNSDSNPYGARVKRFPAFPSLPGLTMPRPISNFGNSAFASAAAGPGFQHQVASIFPNNPSNPNVEHFSDASAPSNGGFYSVSSKSFSSSSNVNGKELSNRGAETLVNDNGKVTHYKVQS